MAQLDEIQTIRKYENAHILLWLIKDTFWVMGFTWLGTLMIVPTISIAIYITWKFRQFKAELFHNIAVCFWISANATWMIGEFFFDEKTKPIAVVLFLMGLAVLGYYYLIYSRLNSVSKD
jgi:hypothetical protein